VKRGEDRNNPLKENPKLKKGWLYPRGDKELGKNCFEFYKGVEGKKEKQQKVHKPEKRRQ